MAYTPPQVLDRTVWDKDNSLRSKVQLISQKFGRGSFISTRFIERSDREIKHALHLYTQAFSARMHRKYPQAVVECVYDTSRVFVFKTDVVCPGIAREEQDRLQQLLVYDVVDADTFLQANPKLWYYSE